MILRGAAYMAVVVIGGLLWVQIELANEDRYGEEAHTASMVWQGKTISAKSRDEFVDACSWSKQRYLVKAASWYGLNEAQVKEACTKEVRVHGE